MLIPTFLIKLTELVLTIACLVLHHYSYDLTDVTTLILCSGTYVGFLVVLSGEIVGEMIFAPLDLLQDMFFGIVGMIMFSFCGGMVLAARLKPSPIPRTGDHIAAIIAGTLALLNALLMFLDLSMGYLDSEEFRELVSATSDAFVDAWWSCCGAALFGACGALTLLNWKDVPDCQRKYYGRAAAACALANTVLLVLDALTALCAIDKDDLSSRPRAK